MVKDVESRIEIFRDIIKLAEKRRKLVESDQEYTKENDALKKYVDNLSFEDVKVLQTVMYLGRDREYDENLSSSEIYKEVREGFDMQGWDSKEIEAHQMTGKIPLDQYLNNGLKILEINWEK